jgi:hypothetical protein
MATAPVVTNVAFPTMESVVVEEEEDFLAPEASVTPSLTATATVVTLVALLTSKHKSPSLF